MINYNVGNYNVVPVISPHSFVYDEVKARRIKEDSLSMICADIAVHGTIDCSRIRRSDAS